jgi:hypothetical protein
VAIRGSPEVIVDDLSIIFLMTSFYFDKRWGFAPKLPIYFLVSFICFSDAFSKLLKFVCDELIDGVDPFLLIMKSRDLLEAESCLLGGRPGVLASITFLS